MKRRARHGALGERVELSLDPVLERSARLDLACAALELLGPSVGRVGIRRGVQAGAELAGFDAPGAAERKKR